MVKQCKFVLSVTAVTLILLILGLPGHEAGAQASHGGGIVVIANQAVVDSVLNRRTVAQIFLNKKKTWSNRESIEIVTLTEGDVHEEFLREFLRKSPKQYADHWDRLVFTGTARIPRGFKNESEVVAYVARVDGAIGYISGDSAIPTSGVKRIAVVD